MAPSPFCPQGATYPRAVTPPGATYGGSPPASSASSWREPSLPAEGKIGGIWKKNILGAIGRSMPVPVPFLTYALGSSTTHIVGVVVLVVGQLHHSIGALERDMWVTNQKTLQHQARLLCIPQAMQGVNGEHRALDWQRKGADTLLGWKGEK